MAKPRTRVDVQIAKVVKQLNIERAITAPPGRIFDAFTDPEQLTQWWWPDRFTCSSAEVDLRVGGTFRLAMEWPDDVPADAQFSHTLIGEYYEVDRPHRLVMSGRSVDEEHEELFATLIELTFEDCEAGTILTMRQSFFEPLPPAEAFTGAVKGWSEQLDKLEHLLVQPPDRMSDTIRKETR